MNVWTDWTWEMEMQHVEMWLEQHIQWNWETTYRVRTDWRHL